MDISVVIPVYNVEKYLKKCVDSILHQTISNYEVILVDDGSPDGCPAICDAYAAEHPNVIALHKTNGGLSDARNYGVQHASADYVVFVDSDDYVDSEYLESLWKLHTKYDADIVVQGVVRENEAGSTLSTIRSFAEKVLTPEKAIEAMCNGREFGIYAVAKLYPKKYLLTIPFPLGRLHEDIFTTYKLIDQGCRIAVGDGCHYHYCIRADSILTSTFNMRHMDSIQGSIEIIKFVKDKYPQIVNASYVRLALESNALLHRAVSSGQYHTVRKTIMNNLESKWHVLLSQSELSSKIKFQLLLCKLSASLYKQLYFFAKNKTKSVSNQ